MNKNKIFLLALLFPFLFAFSLLSAQDKPNRSTSFWENKVLPPAQPKKTYPIRIAISHGHCSRPLESCIKYVNVQRGAFSPQDLKINFGVHSAFYITTEKQQGKRCSTLKVANDAQADQQTVLSFTTHETRNLGGNSYKLKGIVSIEGQSAETTLLATPIYEDSHNKTRLVKFFVEGKVSLDDLGLLSGVDVGPPGSKHFILINLEVSADGC